MPKYRVEFTETRRYTVEFETDTVLDLSCMDADEPRKDSRNDPFYGALDEEPEPPGWFEAMHAANDDWPACHDVVERELCDIEFLDDDHDIS